LNRQHFENPKTPDSKTRKKKPMKPTRRNPLIRIAIIATFGILSFATFSAAATYQWNGSASSDWATDANWTGPPPADSEVVGSHRLNVNGATALTYSADQGTSVFASAADRGLVIGSGTAGSGTMNITGGTFSTLGAASQDVIGNTNNNTGTLHISGGAFIGTNAGTVLGLGGGMGRVSNLTLSGSGSATLSSLVLNSTTIRINLNGGTLELNSFVPLYIESSGEINFNGGAVKARLSTINFLPANANLQVLVQSGGAIIDTNNFDITIAEPLLEDPASPGGGLIKNSGGLLTLSTPSTLTGPVQINAGGLSLKPGTSLPWEPSSLTHTGDILNFDLGVYNEYNPVVIETGALTVNSAVTVNVTGSNFQIGQIPLIQYTSKSITGSLTLNPATLPANVVATLADDNNGLIYLNVTEAPTSFVWSGDIDTPGTGDWDTTSLNWNNFADAYSVSGKQVAQFPDTPGGGIVTITGNFSPANITITNASGNPYTFDGSGVITGTTTLSKSGTGIAVLAGAAHTFSGTTSINAGALIKQAADETTGDIIVAADNVSFVLDGGITDGAGQTLYISGRGATGAGYFFTGSQVQRGALQAHNGASTWQGDVVLTSTAASPNFNRIGVQPGASLTLTGLVSEGMAGAGLLLRAGALGEDITLAGPDTYTYTGGTELYSTGGSIILGASDKLATGAFLSLTPGGSTVLDLNGFNQTFTGIFGAAIGFAATITNSGDNPSILTSNVPAGISRNFQGNLTNDGESLSFVKTGGGTQILSYSNSYSGTTTVNGGTLLINGNHSDATGAVQVNAATLGGSGTIGGQVTVGALGTLAPGTAGTIGILDIFDNTSIAGTFACDIDGANTDQLSITGDLDLTNGALSINQITPGTPGTYVIATYTGTRTGELGGSLPPGYSVTYNDAFKEVELVVAAPGGYAQWAIINAVTEGEGGDDDRDGISNLVEYALGLNPQVPDATPGTFVGNLLTFTKGPEAKAAGDLTYTIETSTTLATGSWSPTGATETDDAISFSLPSGQPGGKLFARLKVTKS